MAVYRVINTDGNKITVHLDGARIYLDPTRPYDDKNPDDKVLLDRFPGHFRAENVETATAVPGQKRQVARARK